MATGADVEEEGGWGGDHFGFWREQNVSKNDDARYSLCDTRTSSATFHTPDVTKQSWKLRCPVQRKKKKKNVSSLHIYMQAFGVIKDKSL